MSRRSESSYITHNARLAVLSTGSDACAEHEMGIAKLLGLLSGRGPVLSSEDYGRRKKTGLISVYPSVLSFRRVVVPERIQSTTQVICGEEVFVVGTYINPRELYLRAGQLHAEWDEGCFLLAARERTREADILRQFLGLAKDGYLIIGGTPAKDIAPDERFSGIVFSDIRKVSKQALEQAQHDFEAGCRIWEESEIDEVRRLAAVICGRDFSYIWPTRMQDGRIGYRINPSYETQQRLAKVGLGYRCGDKDSLLDALTRAFTQ